MKRIFTAILALWSVTTMAGLPPTSIKGQGDTNYSTFFKLNLGNQSISKNGVEATLNSSADKNYILNPDAEVNTTGWNVYTEEDTVTMTIASPAVLSVPSTFGYYAGMPISLTTTGALPTGLSVNTVYYVSSVVSGTTVKLSATLGGADINTSGSQSGTHTIRLGAPISMTGGTPLSTFTRSTSSPLNDSASFVFSKPASNRMGDIFKTDITIDSADTTKVLRIDLNYQVSSGTYVDDDMACWVRDQTSGSLIQPAPYKIKNTTGKETLSMEFQATTSTTYRFGCHVASTSTSAYDLKFDKFKISRGAKVSVSPISDPVTWTPTFTGVGTATNVSCSYVRNGGDAVGGCVFTSGTVTAGTVSISLPTGLSLDSSRLLKSNTSSAAGQKVGDYFGNASSNAGAVITAPATSLSHLYFGYYATGGANLTPSTGSQTLTSSQTVSFNFRVPILGWSSSVQSSNEADTRVFSAIYKTASGQSIPNTTSTIVNFGTVEKDTHSAVTTGASWKLTAQSPGIYRVSSMIQFASNNYGSSVVFEANLFKNGSVVGSMGYFQNSATGVNVTPSLTGSRMIEMVAGDYIDVRAYQNSGGAQPLSASTQYNHVSIEKISGPSQIAASETVSASYWVSANFAASATTPINFDSKEWDTHNSVTTSATAWKFTAPESGEYTILGFLGGSTSAYIRVYKGGSISKSLGYGTVSQPTTLSGKIKLLAGEYIDIRPQVAVTFDGGAITGDSVCKITITRTGNY